MFCRTSIFPDGAVWRDACHVGRQCKIAANPHLLQMWFVRLHKVYKKKEAGFPARCSGRVETLRDIMQRIPVFIVSLFLLFCMHLTGCGNKTKAVDDEVQDDLFVEYHEYYFPEKIETLALGELAGYKGRLDSPFPGKRNVKNRRSARGMSRVALPTNLPESRRQLLRAAESAIGTPYVLGGMAPGGFDCSGLVCWAYGNVGVKLPRTAREQSVVGASVRRVEDMQAGDIVTFRHPKRGYHSGIYVGDGKFIHSPRRRSHVKINSLDDPYFHDTFLSARRVKIGSRENLLAQAEQRLQRDTITVHREDSRASRNASRYKRSLSKAEKRRAEKMMAVAERRERNDSYRGRSKRGRDVREEKTSRSDRRSDRSSARESRQSKKVKQVARKESHRKDVSAGRSRKAEQSSGKQSRRKKK